MLISIEKKYMDKVFNVSYDIMKGWPSLADASRAVSSVGYDPSLFGFVHLLDQWYAVTMDGYSNHIVMTQKFCRIKSVKWKKFFGNWCIYNGFDKLCTWESLRLETLPVIKAANIDKAWIPTVLEDLTEINGEYIQFVPPAHKRAEGNFRDNCIILLGITMFSEEMNAFQIVSCFSKAYFTNPPKNILEACHSYSRFNPFHLDTFYSNSKVTCAPSKLK